MLPRSDAATVLIVDDDPVVLRVLGGVLTRAGYQVVAAASVAEALREARCGPDVCLLDLCLPDGSGLDLADALSHSYPGVPLILMSGSAELVRDRPELRRFVQVLTKPPDLQTIRQAIAAALEPTRAPAEIA
jgi:two-component system, NtrC family, response regulator PilR